MQLSTRFVRTWRDKEMVIDGKPIRVWVRSRFVARGFAWLSDDKQSMFSPASSSISSRILPVFFLQHRDDDWILMSCDVQDAFLTVKQRDPTMIVAKDAAGNEQPYALGRVLPGQRAGSQLWNEDITNHLKQSMLNTKDNKLFILLHVDDLLVTGHADKVQKQLIPALQSAYKISYSIMKEMGEELTFLKRRHVLVNDRLMLIKSHHKHVAQLKEIMDIHPKAYPKKTPAHPAIDNEDIISKFNFGRSRLDKVQKCSRYFVVFSTRFTTLSALHSFLGNQDDVSYAALLASLEAFTSVPSWQSRSLFKFEFQR